MGEGFTPREITGEMVVREARAWLGVPYKAAGTTREGVCCAGLPFGAGKALGQIPLDARLPAHHPLNPNPRIVLGCAREHLREITVLDARPGDVVAMSLGERPLAQHLAVVTPAGLLQLFPARSIGRVAEHGLDAAWSSRILFAFRYKGVRD